ncbi:MAG TPA: hypothetical protein VF735_04765 [Pyrinomonadaceae bacterium]|jgi:ribosomal protein L40E
MEILFFLFIFFAIITLIGHGIWLALAWFFRLFRTPVQSATHDTLNLDKDKCAHCGATVYWRDETCRVCGWSPLSSAKTELLRELAATERQVGRLHKSGAIDYEVYARVMRVIETERERLGAPARPRASEPARQPAAPSSVATPEDVSPHTAASDKERQAPSFMDGNGQHAESTADATQTESPDEELFEQAHAWAREDQNEKKQQREQREQKEQARQPRPATPPPPPPPPPVEPRRPFGEMLASFMEQSNIRWGEIIGGLLIIGCSTALVISLWNEIARVPVLKFIIFTTVTAALFGVGFYTEHHWKLPTTSRGILTIATLLVPLNFLAIAAVSGSSYAGGNSLVIASELIAPALFLCLVYYAGRVITPGWPHLLASGVLGSSLGQLIVRHFAGPNTSPFGLILLGAFPFLCYTVAGGWMIRRASLEEEIKEESANSIFITLGAATFSTLLPVGLLLFKTGQASATLMHIAPLISLGGMLLLMSGMLLHRRVTDKALAATHTAGTSIALIGALVCVSSIAIGWPNPASVASAALLNFAVFTALALLFELSLAHLLAAICFALAYMVGAQALLGHIGWQQARAISLLGVIVSVSNGQWLTLLFVLFVVAAFELERRRQSEAGQFYLSIAVVAAVFSLMLLTLYGFGRAGDPHGVAFIFAVYAAGAFLIAWRKQLPALSWTGSALLLLALMQGIGPWLRVRFPGQAAMLAHASLAALAAIFSRQKFERGRNVFTRPLNLTALASSVLFLLLLLQARRSEPTAMIAARLYWLSAVWLLLLWLNRVRLLFTAFQIALTAAVLLSVKLYMQGFEWYAYLPNAWLHPWSLQVQASVLVLLSLVWIALRIWMRGRVARRGTSEESGPAIDDASGDEDWASAAWRLLNERNSFDRLIPGFVLGCFAVLTIYGALPGVRRELAARGTVPFIWNLAGFPHEHVLEAGSWSLLALLVLTMLAGAWERRRAHYLLGLTLTLACTCTLLAGRWEAVYATASAWRWLAAGFLIIASIPLLLRAPLIRQLKTFGWPEIDAGSFDAVRGVRLLLLALTLTPILILTLYPAARAVHYNPATGPSSGFFYFIGEVFSYSIPLALVALVLIGHAVRERAPAYAFAAGLFLNIAVTLAHILSVSIEGGSMNRVVLAQVAQSNAIVSACYVLIWLSWRVRWKEHLAKVRAGATAELLLKIQLSICVLINALLIAPPLVKLFTRPTWTGIGTFEAGSVRGWLALLLTCLAAAWFARAYGKRLQAGYLYASALAAGALISFDLSRLDMGRRWLGFHAFLIAGTLTGWLMLLLRRLPSSLDSKRAEQFSEGKRIRERVGSHWEFDAALCAVLGLSLTVMMALRAAINDPQRPWWSIGALLAVGLLATGLNWQTLHRAYLYVAALLFNLAVLIWWTTGRWDEIRSSQVALVELLEVNVIALALPGVAWLLLELRARRLDTVTHGRAFPAFHNVAAIAALMFIPYMVLLEGHLVRTSALLGWLALASGVVLLTACLWDRQERYAVGGLYLLGLMAAGLALDHQALGARQFGWAIMIILSSYALLTSLVWKSREALMRQGERLHIPRREGGNEAGLNWLRPVNAVLAASVVLLAYWVDLSFVEWPLRVLASVAVAAQLLTFGLLAEGAKRARWQRVAVGLFILGVVFFGWGWLVPGTNGTWLNRAVITLIVMISLIAFFAAGSKRLAAGTTEDWAVAVRGWIPWMAGAGALALAFVLCTEIFYQTSFGAVRINLLSLLTVGVALIGACVMCIFFAVSPENDPLRLDERMRMKYVYVAEAMLALLFMHIRLTMPWLFTGFFERYWPLVVIGLAYFGVAISEALRRQGLMVLAKPVERTGAMLPLMPVLGFWAVDSQVDFSALLFITGALYGGLSILRRSFGFGLLAALCGNGGLWYMLNRTEDYGFLRHPQLWLIPAALSVLVAAYLNRDRFTEDQMTTTRYITLMIIYVSSTSDIFINGVAQSPWLPLILAGLSLAGVLGGIMFRVRAFLFLGATFLLVAVLTMIWYASVNLGWTWLWYVAGIVTGALIIFTFALFEKKRVEVLRVVEDLRGWSR